MAVWVDKLVTKEDPYHVHKTLGILCLVSFIVRFLQLGTSDAGFSRFPEWTVPTLLIHFLLNLSSFEFKIPSKRISSGSRIWPEYRLHSFVFLCRSLALMLLTYVEDRYSLARNDDLNMVIVFATLAGADFSSWLERKNHSPSIRDLDTSPYVKYFFSFMQFNATALCLYGLRRYTTQLSFVMIIQVNAFLMTLRRKNLAGHNFLVACYGFLLIFGTGVSAYEHITSAQGITAIRVVGLMSFPATLLRTGPRLPVISIIQNNKYLMWLLLGVAARTIRPMVEPRNATPQHTENERILTTSLRILLLLVVILPIYKVRRQAASENKTGQEETGKVGTLQHKLD